MALLPLTCTVRLEHRVRASDTHPIRSVLPDEFRLRWRVVRLLLPDRLEVKLDAGRVADHHAVTGERDVP